MKDFQSWFNPQEYADFLAESSLLFEANIPLQKQKFENRKKMWNFDAQTARKRANLKMELMRDAAQAKARGIQMGMGESFQARLMDEFIERLMEEKTPLKREKTKMRPEVDPADRERDRKRESRKQNKMEGLGNILIVKHRGMSRIEIIEREDFDPKVHELVKGKTKNGDKGRVTIQDLQNAAQRSDFRNTKTSIKILGKIQKQVEDEQAQAQADAQENGDGGQQAPQQQMAAPPPPPRPRAPSDGKEITDEASTYPDWDHQINQLTAMVPEILNTLNGIEMSGDAQQMISDSRTLGDSLNRFVNGFVEGFPSAGQFNYELFTKPIKASNWYAKKLDNPVAAPVATFIGKSGEQTIGFNLKIGKQLRLTNKLESGIVFDAAMSKVKLENMSDFSVLYQDMVDDFRKTLNTRSNYLPVNTTGEKTLISDLMMNKLKTQESIAKQKQVKDRFKELIEVFVNQNEAIKLGYIAEALTGNIRFDGEVGSAQFLVVGNKDGTDTKVIQLTPDYLTKIAKSKETTINLKFADDKMSPEFQTILQNVGQINEGVQDAVSIMDQIKQVAADPKKLMKMAGIKIIDAVFSVPVDLREYFDEDSDSVNTVIINPGSPSEETVTIPVKRNYTPDGKEQNYIERGADELLESYLLINDCLVDLVKKENIDLLEALIVLEEEFNLLSEKRNYRKEYDNYHSKKKQRENRSKRVLARRKMMKKGKVRKGDGKDVDHKNGNPQDNSDDNLRVLSKSKNRSMNEDHGAGFEGTSKLLKKFLKDTPFSGNPTETTSEVTYKEDKYTNKTKK